jgi:hypothetical protein
MRFASASSGTMDTPENSLTGMVSIWFSETTVT